MSCTKCKKKERIVEFEKSTEFIDKGVILFVIVWSLFAIYGIYTFINSLL
jgi:hypothetical protein